jgi:hypothetical protein
MAHFGRGEAILLGQLGDGVTTSKNTPTQIGYCQRLGKSISVGWEHTIAYKNRWYALGVGEVIGLGQLG